ncbi:MAG: metal-dependent transcriptional regulator [Clostridiales bacterium]|nr:metal-dependent transcriptional regulator [Clostridiales bacterium]
MILTESREDYLEMIYVLGKQYRIVRNVDVAHAMNRTKASVTTMVHSLVEEGYLVVEKRGGHLALTEKGEAIAKITYDRHVFYRDLLIRAGVEPELAEREGCIMEHILCEESHNKLVQYLAELEYAGSES